MTLLNDTIADINLEVDTVSAIYDTVLKLKEEAEERKCHMDADEHEELMWNYNNAIDSLESVIKELRYASKRLVEC